MRLLFLLLVSWSFVAQATPTTVHVDKETTLEQFQSWLIEAAQGSASVQFEFVNSEKSFDPFTMFSNHPDINKSRGDIFFLIGDLTKGWSEEEYDAYFPIARWLSIQGFRAVINPAAYISDIRDAVQSSEARGIIWSGHGSKEGKLWDKADAPLPQPIFSNRAARGLKHFVLGNCYGDQVANHYSFPFNSGVHHFTGEIDSDEFFAYLTSREWRDDIQEDLKFKLKKRPPKKRPSGLK